MTDESTLVSDNTLANDSANTFFRSVLAHFTKDLTEKKYRDIEALGAVRALYLYVRDIMVKTYGEAEVKKAEDNMFLIDQKDWKKE
jgi:hypothetical protein